MSAGLTITTTGVGPVLVVAVVGDIDIATAPQLREALHAAVAASAALVIDMSGVTFLGSSGLSELILAHRAALGRDGALVLSALGPASRKLLAITGVDELLRCYPSTAAAINGAFPA